jgi:HSP20 family protein
MLTNKPAKVETAGKPVAGWEDPFGFPLFRRLSHEFDAIFDRFGLEKPFFETPPSTWVPEMEMFTKENTLHVRLDIPGMKKENLNIEVTDEHLVVSGERTQEKEEKKEGFYRTERSYGSFYRTVPLPDGVKADAAKATMKDGVLEITMPVAAVETKARKLEIGEPAVTPGATKAA